MDDPNCENRTIRGVWTIPYGEMAQKVIEWDMYHVKSYAWEIEMAQFQNGSKSRSRVFLLRWLTFWATSISHAYDFTWDMSASMTFCAIDQQFQFISCNLYERWSEIGFREMSQMFAFWMFANISWSTIVHFLLRYRESFFWAIQWVKSKFFCFMSIAPSRKTMFQQTNPVNRQMQKC